MHSESLKASSYHHDRGMRHVNFETYYFLIKPLLLMIFFWWIFSSGFCFSKAEVILYWEKCLSSLSVVTGMFYVQFWCWVVLFLVIHLLLGILWTFFQNTILKCYSFVGFHWDFTDMFYMTFYYWVILYLMIHPFWGILWSFSQNMVFETCEICESAISSTVSLQFGCHLANMFQMMYRYWLGLSVLIW